MGRFERLRLRVTLEGAGAVEPILRSGLVTYPEVMPATDRLFAATGSELEELLVLRSADAPFDFSWRVELPSGLTSVKSENGGLVFSDESGRARIAVPAPFVIDAKGERRALRLAWNEETRVATLNVPSSGLRYPLLVDPSYRAVEWAHIPQFDGVASHAMAFDAMRGEVVSFGGFDRGDAPTNETWVWRSGRWSLATPLHAPPPLMDSALAFDAVLGKLLLFGGRTPAGGQSADTWLWDGADWIRSTAVGPSARERHGIARDPLGRGIVLIGGLGSSVASYVDQWLWNGTSWTQQSAGSAPSSRGWHAMGADPMTGRILLFGGMARDGTVLDDTWEWDGSSWTQRNPVTRPSARYRATITRDPSSGRALLFGGMINATLAGRAYRWTGSDWALASDLPASLINRIETGSAVDVATNRVTVAGGQDSFGLLQDTWTGDASGWQASTTIPPRRGFPAMTYARRSARAVLFGGECGPTLYDDTWQWDGSQWQKSAPARRPSARSRHAMTYDAARDRVVLFGGFSKSPDTVLGDTWTWDGSDWTQSAAASPAARWAHKMTFDEARGEVLLFGGNLATAFSLSNETWRWNGSAWTKATPPSAPSPRMAHGMTFDSARGEVVVFGGTTDSLGNANDTWTWNGSTWTEHFPGVRPLRLQSATLAFDTKIGRTVCFGGVSDGVSLNAETWLWNGNEWTKALTSLAPSARSAPDLVWDSARGRMLMYGGTSYGLLVNQVCGADLWQSQVDGVTCAADGECLGGHCVDGACCNAASCGLCETCNGTAPGTCTPVRNDEDPDTCALGDQKSCSDLGTCKKALGVAAPSAEECASGFLVDGVCCADARCGSCQACDAAKKEHKEFPGRCGAAKRDSDPHDDCSAEGGETCGKNGACDGAGACAFYSAGTSCGASTCHASRVTGSICDGKGTCANDADGIDCAPFSCDNGACRSACESNTQCAALHHCDQGQCVQDASTSCEDERTVLSPVGSRIDCAPFKCSDGACLTRCDRITDCVFPASCTTEGTCVSAPSASPPSGGCSQAARSHAGAEALSTLVPFAWILRRRARRRRSTGAAVACVGLTWIACAGSRPTPEDARTESAALGTQTFRAPIWAPIELSTIEPHQHGGMAYDAARGQVIAFGGRGVSYAPSGATWLWNSTTWTRPRPASEPPAREWARLAFDAVRNQVVLFGGSSGSALGDTWTWDGTTWTPRVPVASPGPRLGHAMAFDAARGKVVLFGGNVAGAEVADTWTWDGAAWLSVATPPANTPPARTMAAMAYDEVRREVLLFGGTAGRANFGDTWAWNGTQWSQRATTGPSPRADLAMAYERSTGKVVLYGGCCDGANVAFGDTWAWDGATWSQLTSTISPGARRGHAMVYDGSRVLLNGGLGRLDTRGASDTWAWAWNGSRWDWSLQERSTNPAARVSHAMSYDSDRRYTLMFGGGVADGSATVYYFETWTLQGTRWNNLTPLVGPPDGRVGPALAYDRSQRAHVLFGGLNTSVAPVNSTWLFDGSAWSRVTVQGSAPPARWSHALAYDEARGNTVLFGGQAQGGNSVSDTWVFDASRSTWTQRSPATAPSARTGHAMTYDPDRQRVILFGGAGQTSATLADTWEWDGASWANRTTAIQPQAREGALLVYDRAHKVTILMGGALFRGAALDDMWLWDGTSWTEAAQTTRPSRRKAAAGAYDESTGRIVLFGGTYNAIDTTTGNQTADYLFDGWNGYLAGDPCTSSSMCPGGTCVDGVCCRASSCGTCESCNGSEAGQCSPVVNREDADTCGARDSKSCNARGECKAALGVAATQASDCASGYVTDGVCCASATCGACETCNAASKERPEFSGRCSAAKNGTDPHDDCSDQGAQSCGTTGRCDGAGHCSFYGAGVSCGASTCAASRAAGQVCSGIGTCTMVPEGVDCGGYACKGGGCVPRCAADEDCNSLYECVRESCVPKRGATCDGNHTLVRETGELVDCGLYVCEGAACRTSCSRVTDCVFPAQCSADGKCIPYDEPVAESGGCGVGRWSARPSSAWALIVVGAGWWGGRRRRSARFGAAGRIPQRRFRTAAAATRSRTTRRGTKP